MEGGAFADTFEVAAPWDKVLGVYEQVRAAVAPYAFVLCHFSHAYLEGCSLYFSFVGAAAADAQERERYDTVWRVALSAAQSAGANVSHHHGIGLLKARALQDALGDGRHALRALKLNFDPDGIMNPGKLGL
jgi:alkyldihydroxyacetonephosphate synthase